MVMKTEDIRKGLKEFFEKEFSNELNQAFKAQETVVEVPFTDVEGYDTDLAQELHEEPETVLRDAKKIIKKEVSLKTSIPRDLEIVITDLPDRYVFNVKELRSEHINKLVTLKGVVSKASEVTPSISIGCFECQKCGEHSFVEQENNVYREPYECAGCERKSSFRLLPTESEVINFQKLRVQEPPEILEGGEKPQNIDCSITDERIIGKAKPGNKVRVTGVFKAVQKDKGRNKSTKLDTFIKTTNLEVSDKEFEDLEITKKDKEKIHELSQSKNIYSKIVNSINPSIKGREQIKEAIALQLFGANSKETPDGTRIRGDIHVLVIGDPGTGKSQLVSSVTDIAPRGIYVSAQSSSAAGLTAAAVQDEFSDGWTIEGGALVLADKGMAVVDEFDKMSEDDRDSMTEALEQQMVSVAKAGITTNMWTRCGLLAAANPLHGRYDPYELISEQIDLSPAMISRFDLIFPLRDQPREDVDQEVAEHISKTQRVSQKIDRGDEPEEGELNEIEPDIDKETLRKYIALAKEVKPVLTDEASRVVKEFYVDIRNKSSSSEEGIPVTARQIEALYRLAEACARVRLSEEINRQDAERAIKLVESCLTKISTDPETGALDSTIIETGKSKNQIDSASLTKRTIKELVNEEGRVRKERVVEALVEKDMSEEKAEKYIDKLINNGEIYQPNPGVIKTM